MTILQETFVTPSPSTIWDGVPSRRSSCRNSMFFTVHQWEFRFGSVCRHSDAESTQALLKVGSWVVIVTIGLLLKGGNVLKLWKGVPCCALFIWQRYCMKPCCMKMHEVLFLAVGCYHCWPAWPKDRKAKHHWHVSFIQQHPQNAALRPCHPSKIEWILELTIQVRPRELDILLNWCWPTC